MANTNTGAADATFEPISEADHALQDAENRVRYEQDAQGDDPRAFFEDALHKRRDPWKAPRAFLPGIWSEQGKRHTLSSAHRPTYTAAICCLA